VTKHFPEGTQENLEISQSGNRRDLIEVLAKHFPGGTEENLEKSQDSRCPDQDSNQAHTEYKSRALPLGKCIR
jgi:hypothetical protein